VKKISTTIDLATYAYNLELNDKGFTSGILGAEGIVDNLQSKMGGFSTFLKGAVVGGIVAVGVALVGMGVKGVKSADELQKALNSLSTQTGATVEETEQFKDSLLNIYNNNFGESFNDIAESMATVQQTLKQTGQELENTTQTALMMRDTFGYDVTESINTVNGLMKNFGITAEQAYTLVAQGAQQGADKNNDMLDTLNEYGTHFAQLGISAEEFTDTLIQGAESGAFQIDKIGDAVKEFSIRSKDMSSTSAQGFQLLGLNADEMFATFATGGDGAEQAFQEVLKKLTELNDPLAQNQAGVALFGTQFEDLGIQGIQALSDIGDKANMTADTLKQINDVKYNSFGEALTGIKRNLETSILLPIGQQILPYLNKFASWFSDNLPQIQATMGGVLSVLGELIMSVVGLIGGLISVLQELYIRNKAIFDGIALIIQIAFNIIVSVFKMTTALLKGDWSAFGTELQNLTQNMFNLIKSIFNLQLTLIQTVLKNSISSFTSLGNVIMNALYSAFKSVWDSIISWFNKSIKSLISWFTSLYQSFYDAGAGIFTAIWDGLKSVWESLSSWISDKVEWIKDKLAIWNSAQSQMSSNDDYESGSSNITGYAVGTPYVPNDQIALIHKGEAIIPAQYNPFNSSNNNAAGVASNSSSVVYNISGITVKANNGEQFISSLTNIAKTMNK